MMRIILFMAVICTLVIGVHAQTTAFTFQGSLQNGGTPANGNYDFEFKLFDLLAAGTQQGSTIQRLNVVVANGVFAVSLDFGAGTLPGADRFLDISVRTAGGGAFTALTPRQRVNSTPYSVRSLNAETAASVTVAGIPSGSGNYIQNTTSPQPSSNFSISGDGAAGTFNAATQYNIRNQRILGVSGCQVPCGYPYNNTFVGAFAGSATVPTQGIEGNGNSFVGNFAGYSNTSGLNNSFFGFLSGVNSTTGNFNSFFGENSGRAVNGDSNSYFGTETADLSAGTGSGNSGFGFYAARAITSGSYNSFVGRSSGESITTGSNNSFFGSRGASATVENANTLVGYESDIAAGVTNGTAIGSNAKVSQSNSLVLGSISGVNGAIANTNVGIGITAPTRRLHVVGDSLFKGIVTVGTGSGSRLEVGAGFDGQPGPIDAIRIIGPNSPADANSAQDLRWSFASAGSASIRAYRGNAWDTFMQFSTNAFGQGSDSPQVRMHIDQSGRIGIATTSPDSTLTVNGTASKPGGGSWATFSDERLKNITGRFTPGLNAVMMLDPIVYKYKPDNAVGIESSEYHVGFSAQAVQKIIPEAISRDERGLLLINNDPIMWTMLNAVKEQQSQIEAQAKEITEQRAVNKKLESDVGELKLIVCQLKPESAVCKQP